MPPKKEASAEHNKKLEDHKKRLENLEQRVGKNERAIKAMEKSLQLINGQLTDLKRQECKSCINLTGNDLPKRMQNENPTSIFIQQVRSKYGVRINEDEIAVVHRTAAGGLIAKFNKFDEGSGYHRLVIRRGKGSMNPNPSIHVYANVMLTKFDAKIRFYAAIAKKHGEVLFYEQLLSGRIGIVVPDPKAKDKTIKIAINDFEDIKPYMTAPALEEIEKKNKERKKRRTKAKSQLSSKQVDELLRSDTEDQEGAEGMDES